MNIFYLFDSLKFHNILVTVHRDNWSPDQVRHHGNYGLSRYLANDQNAGLLCEVLGRRENFPFGRYYLER
jgi:hypothetical protein